MVKKLSFEWSHFRISSKHSKSLKHLVQHNKELYRKVLLKSSYLNGQDLNHKQKEYPHITLKSVVNGRHGPYRTFSGIMSFSLF